jgi:minichromosome maintenance protein 10
MAQADRMGNRKRTTTHEAVQAHLSGRYHLTPSQLYSIIRLSRDGATYDIPVDGDWLTIAVVAERGDIRVSGSKELTHDYSDEEDQDQDEDLDTNKNGEKGIEKAKEKELARWKKRRGPRKYINLKLCALGPRTPGQGQKSTGGGDAMLQLLLFESDAVVRGEPDENGNEKRMYRGGSGGAYEKWCNLGVGSVVVIMNPRVLKPLRVSGV